MAKVTLKRINIFSVAKWYGVIGLLSGHLHGTINFLIYLYESRRSHIYFSYYDLISSPLIFFIVTFLGALIGGGIYNLLSNSLGGMTFEIETDDVKTNFPPPPPETWS